MISEQLQTIYANYNDTRRYYDTISLYHPNFDLDFGDCVPSITEFPRLDLYPCEGDKSVGYFLIRDVEEHILRLEDGSTVTFKPYPFNIEMPEVGSEQQDINIVLDNVLPELSNQIQRAILNPTIPIKMTYRTYIEGSDEVQMSPITLSLTNLTATGKGITAKASRVDLYKRKFPYGGTTVFDRRFQGLWLS